MNRAQQASADRVAGAWSDAMVRIYGENSNGRAVCDDGALALVSDAGFASLNTAFVATANPGPESLEPLRRAADDVRGAGRPWSIVVRGAATGPVADLAARLGLTQRGDLPLMACAATDAVLRAGREHSASVRAADAAEHDVYTRTVAAGFEAPAELFGTLMGADLLAMPKATAYLAGPPDRPTGTGLLVRGSGVCVLFNIAVVPGARGHGLGRALTARAMSDGFAGGADTAVLISSPAGRALYESMGFRLVETWTAFTAAP
ncbi:hypothetical protein GCM10022255_039070 [Dactylosporangium darangshiense]|uniref:N-acetyltransferase domain-containing protein n=2 Tax=Dactylosporangium darangshiense TaxID=579108 RepID=A0ABP8D9G0_9ACTN